MSFMDDGIYFIVNFVHPFGQAYPIHVSGSRMTKIKTADGSLSLQANFSSSLKYVMNALDQADVDAYLLEYKQYPTQSLKEQGAHIHVIPDPSETKDNVVKETFVPTLAERIYLKYRLYEVARSGEEQPTGFSDSLQKALVEYWQVVMAPRLLQDVVIASFSTMTERPMDKEDSDYWEEASSRFNPSVLDAHVKGFLDEYSRVLGRTPPTSVQREQDPQEPGPSFDSK